MITVVALTTATASRPGSSRISRAASLLISDTTVCGPHCTSTCAITPSAMTLVTRPTNRFRADRPTPDGSGAGVAACCRENSASATPSMTLRPTSSFTAGNAAGVDPPADRVVADAQQLGRLANTELRHEAEL